MMHDSMSYDPIQSQGQGHESLIVGNSSIFNAICIGSWQMSVTANS